MNERSGLSKCVEKISKTTGKYHILPDFKQSTLSPQKQLEHANHLNKDVLSDPDDDSDYTPSHSSNDSDSFGYEELFSSPSKDLKVMKSCSNSKKSETLENQNINPPSDLNLSSPSGIKTFSSFNSGSPISKITIGFTEYRDGKRIVNRVNYCFYCLNKNSQLWRHIKKVHKNELEVINILKLTTEFEKKEEIEMLRNKGNFIYNKKVLITGEGELKVGRRPMHGTNVTERDFTPCPKCLLFVAVTELWRHYKYTCIKKEHGEAAKEDTFNSHLMFMSKSMLSPETDFRVLREKILKHLKIDDISQIIKEDAVILNLGNQLLKQQGIDKGDLIRQSLRLTSRLLIEVRLATGDQSLSVFDILCIQHFDKVLQSVNKLSERLDTYEPHTGMENMNHPTVALKFGPLIKKCLGVKKGMALRSRDENKIKEADNFQDLLNIEWISKVSSNALKIHHSKKFDKTEILPLTNDVRKMAEFLKSELKAMNTRIGKEGLLSVLAYNRLQDLVYARLLTFNRRRSGELAKMLCQTAERSLNDETSNQTIKEIENSLTNVERELCKSLKVLNIRGKRGMKVPVIIPPDALISIRFLLQMRSSAGGINVNNKYFFARKNSHVIGHDIMNKLSNEAQLEAPKLFKSTNLRKYIATVTQILKLSADELSFLCDHLGHSIDVHKNFYRLPQSTLEISKVAKLLIAGDEGKIAQYTGNNFEQIMEGKELSSKLDKTMAKTSAVTTVRVDEAACVESSIYKNIPELIESEAPLLKKVSHQNIVNKRSAAAFCKKPYSNTENRAVMKYFIHYIKNCQELKKGDVMEVKCSEEYGGELDGRDWKNLKFKVHSIIVKQNKEGYKKK